jgi:hypothetical protein
MSDGNGQVDLRRVKIDPGKLKIRELAEIERQVGRKLSSEFAAGELGMDTMQALLWMGLRRQDPTATFEQAGEYDFDALSSAMADDEAEGDGVDPTPNAAATSASSSDSRSS